MTKVYCGRLEAGRGCVWGLILRSTVSLSLTILDPVVVSFHLYLRFCVVMRYVIAVIFSNFSLVAINDGSFGRHPPGSPNDRLMVKFEPLSS